MRAARRQPSERVIQAFSITFTWRGNFCGPVFIETTALFPIGLADTAEGTEAPAAGPKYGADLLVNMSLETGSNPVLDYAMGSAAEKGMILVAAAGNGGKDALPAYPAAHPAVIAVTAIDADARIYKKANRGDYIDLAAPGVDVWAAKAGGGGSYHSGTSFAVPFVVAAIAIEQSATPGATAQQLLAHLRAGAQDLGAKGHDPIYGDGLLTAPKSCGGAAASN